MDDISASLCVDPAPVLEGLLVRRHSCRLRQFFGLAPERHIVCGLSFGYADNAHPANGFRTSRAPLEDAVTWID